MNKTTPTWLAILFAISCAIVATGSIEHGSCGTWATADREIFCMERPKQFNILGLKISM